MDDFIGAIRLFPWDFDTVGWLKCKGQSLPVQQNPALFALLGIKFGGDGQHTFMLPNLPDIQAKTGTISYYIATQGIFPERE
jgi:microcystin-dependent protein